MTTDVIQTTAHRFPKEIDELFEETLVLPDDADTQRHLQILVRLAEASLLYGNQFTSNQFVCFSISHRHNVFVKQH